MIDIFDDSQDEVADAFFEAERRRAEVTQAMAQLLRDANGNMMIAVKNSWLYNRAAKGLLPVPDLIAQQIDGQGGSPAKTAGS